MKNLYNFITEAADNSSKKFDNVAKQLNDLPDKLNIFGESVPEEVRNAFQMVANSKTHSNPFLFATGATYFKMPYVYNDLIRETLSKLKGIKVEESGIKIFVFYKPSDENKKGNGIKLMETGNGSLKKIPTDLQENATCVVFNAYMDVIGKEQMIPGESEYVDKQFVEDLISGSNIDSSWIDSFVYQINTIVDYLESLDLSKKEIANYRLARYGARSKKEPVSTAYSNMLRGYSSFLGGRKDAYDPTDILLFNKKEESVNQIITYCNKVLDAVGSADPNKVNDAKAEFLEKIFKENICMGISLKKLSKLGKIELFNIDGNDGVIKSVTGFRKPEEDDTKTQKQINKRRKNNIQIYCQGDFQFSKGFTDEDGDRLNNTKEVMLTLRTFGSNIIAMDVSLPKGGPAIGKCPVNIWRKVLEVKNTEEKDINKCIEKFNQFLETGDDKKIYEGLLNIIKGAVKEGPSCFPFILLH